MKPLYRLSIIAALCGHSTSGFTADPPVEAPSLPVPPSALCPETDEKSSDNSQAMNISAEHISILENNNADFAGDVVVCLPQSQLRSDTAQFARDKKSMQAEGNINYHNDVIDVTSERFSASMSEQTVKLEKSDYVFAGNTGRGQASLLEIQGKNNVVLNDGTFTTCPIDNDDWQLSAARIEFSREDGWAKAWDASIKINNTPIIYIPYFTFPLDERRKSGFLYPKISSSVKHGVTVFTPWYWNIAPNYDATFTPRVMTKRGIQMQTEFRYLVDDHQGLFNIELLPDDRQRKDLGSRHLLHWQHRSEYGDKLRAFVNFTDISDDAYLNDFGSNYQDRTDTQLSQRFELSYFSHNIDTVISAQDFEVLGPHPSSYRAVPQLSFNNREPYQYGLFDVNWMSEVSHFVNSEADITSANRLHIEPSVSLNYSSPAVVITSELSVLQTNYQQTYNRLLHQEDKDISRTLPKFRFHSLVNFERPSNWLSNNGLQTFEPQVQYLYIPNKHQGDIGLFDSTRLQDDYYGLFRDNRFSGLDRISGANQVTLGGTSRFFDQQNNEVFHLSLGQILYFGSNDSQFTANDSRLSGSKSELASEIFMRWSRRWDLNANVQYDDDSHKITKSNISINYRGNKKTQAQLNHRYTRSVSGSKIEQIGLMASFEIASQWQFVGGYHRDLTNNRSIDSYAGLQYESCCWAIRLVSTRHINTNFEQQDLGPSGFPSTFDSGIALQFTIKGINGASGFNIADMLEEGVFGKRRRYFLNN
ncbi:MAG: LPS-assembly protein [Phenylobacterium sp.]|jgi:LPS-assembly protein